MSLALQGDRAAYENLLGRIAVMVKGYLAGRLREPDRADDLTQDVLIAVHRKKHLYRPDMPILPWIFAIARYRLIDCARTQARRPRLVAWEAEFEPFAARREDGVDHSLELEEVLEDLPDRQRKALLLAKIDGLPLAQVAEKLEMSLSAVKVTIHRAIRALRKKHGVNAECQSEDA